METQHDIEQLRNEVEKLKELCDALSQRCDALSVYIVAQASGQSFETVFDNARQGLLFNKDNKAMPRERMRNDLVISFAAEFNRMSGAK